MIKYLCSDTDCGTGQTMLGDTPEKAFEEYVAYYNQEARIEDLYIYRITAELKGKALYTFEEITNSDGT